MTYQLRHYDNETWQAISLIAELPTSNETPGVAPDHVMNNLIYTARNIGREQSNAVREYDALHYDAATGQRK